MEEVRDDKRPVTQEVSAEAPDFFDVKDIQKFGQE